MLLEAWLFAKHFMKILRLNYYYYLHFRDNKGLEKLRAFKKSHSQASCRTGLKPTLFHVSHWALCLHSLTHKYGLRRYYVQGAVQGYRV